MERIQEIEQRHEHRKWSKTLCNAPRYFEHIDYVEKDIDYLLAENKRYKEALKHYAENQFWTVSNDVVDVGEVAREALKEEE